MTDDRISLTEDESVRLIEQLVRAAGPDGIAEEDLRRKYDIAEGMLIGLKIDAAALRLWTSGQTVVSLTETEDDLRWKLARQ